MLLVDVILCVDVGNIRLSCKEHQVLGLLRRWNFDVHLHAGVGWTPAECNKQRNLDEILLALWGGIFLHWLLQNSGPDLVEVIAMSSSHSYLLPVPFGFTVRGAASCLGEVAWRKAVRASSSEDA